VHEVVAVLLPRKGDLTKLDNHRAICLINIVARILSRVAAKRIQCFAEREGLLPNVQWGFRANRSTRGPIFC